MTRVRRHAVALLLCLLPMAAPAAAQSPVVSLPASLSVPCGLATASLPVTWHFPTQRLGSALVWLQHGFFRTNQNVADLARQYAAAGLVVVTPTLPSLQACGFNDTANLLPNLAPLLADINAPGSALLASARAAAAAVGAPVPQLPERLVLSGHSAGGPVVTFMAADFVTRYPAQAARLGGLVLLDPVESFAGTMRASLPALAAVPILTVSAPPSACNAATSGTQLLRALGRPFIGIEVTSGSHCDAEGASGNPVLCGLVCGTVHGLNVAVLQFFAVNWAVDLALARVNPLVYPGGLVFDHVQRYGLIRPY